MKLPFLPTALALVVAYGATQIAFGERIPLTGGLGTYDGRRYGEVAMDFRREVLEDGLDAFRLQRIVPSAIVWAALGAFGLARDRPHVIAAFLLGNLILQALLVLLWSALGRRAGLGDRGLWLGLVLLFLSFASLKQPYFYPVLTDTPAVLLGALVLYLHLSRRAAMLFATLLLAAFTWPALFLSGSLLYVLDREPLAATPPPRAWNVGVAAASVALMLLVRASRLGLATGSAAAIVSLLVMAAYVFAVSRSLTATASLFDATTWRRAVRPRRLLLVIGAFVVVQVLVASASTAPGMTVGRHLRHVFLYNAERPGLFLLAHAVYFGPVALLVVLLWPLVRATAWRLGLGVTAVLAFQLAHSINAESRQLVDGLPLYVLLATLAAESVPWTVGRTWLVAALGLVASKAWLPINRGEWGSAFEFPAQYYFMNMGPSMSRRTLLVQAAGAAAALIVLWLSLRRARRDLAAAALSARTGALPPGPSRP